MTQGFAREARIGVDLHVGETLYFTANDSFVKADYPGLYGVRVKVQAGGGAGGAGQATSANECSSASGGGGGGYAESIIEAADLGTSETITVGAGGAGNTTTTGEAGDDSSFGSHVTATGGSGGLSGTPTTGTGGLAGVSGGGASGDLIVPGGKSEGFFSNGTQQFITVGAGGSSALGNFGHGGQRLDSGGITAADATGYGAGGSGAGVTDSSAARKGGDGGDGIVIVEVLYERKIAVDEDIHPQYLRHDEIGNDTLNENIDGFTDAGYTKLASLSGASASRDVEVTVTTDTSALVVLSANIISCDGTAGKMAFSISGATTQAASDTQDLRGQSGDIDGGTVMYVVTGLTAGSNTFTLEARRVGGTKGRIQTPTLVVIPL